KEAIDKIVPGARVMVQAAVQQGAVDGRQCHVIIPERSHHGTSAAALCSSSTPGSPDPFILIFYPARAVRRRGGKHFRRCFPGLPRQERHGFTRSSASRPLRRSPVLLIL